LKTDPEAYEVRCAQILIAKAGKTEILAADITYRLVAGGPQGLAIDQKIVALANSADSLKCYGFCCDRQIAIVTGAAQGLGEVIARDVARRGFPCRRGRHRRGRGNAVAVSLDPTGATARAVGLDVRLKASFAAALACLTAQWGECICCEYAAITLTTPVMRSHRRSSDPLSR